MSDEPTNHYDKGIAYWETIPATVDGMLGGFSRISNTDIQASVRFLDQFIKDKKNPIGTKRALDCGSGIGRITKRLLLPIFETVDMVEQNQKFIDAAPEYIGADCKRLGQCFCCGLQDFSPQPGRYNVIWCQWVTGHLTDSDFVEFLGRCKVGLAPDGIVVVKDNITSSQEIDSDHKDGSITRPKELILEIFDLAGMTLLCQRKQVKFPRSLYEVKMFALR